MSAPVVGRFAPTPSGRLHLGNLLCALIAYLSVRHRDGRFLLRIEDLDKPRCPRRLCDAALSDLTWLGLIWDEPPLVQSERTELYQSYFDMLDEKRLITPASAPAPSSTPPTRPTAATTRPFTAARARVFRRRKSPKR